MVLSYQRHIVYIMVLLTAAVSITACTGPTAGTLPAPDAVVITDTVPVGSPAGLASPTTPSPSDTPGAPVGPVSLSRNILPIFEASCIKCHGGEKTEKGLDLTTYSAMMAGSERGLVIIPGSAGDSRLAQLVTNGKMPKRGTKLTPDQVQLIVDWINAGAQNN